ncbi:uncharacterized protein [Antennarius striatus]|uniref:uncharacterized protein isoform X2 n=1 Tax=Antennarius striatus TaxID=241820 RepID=UPI0035B3263D
MMPSWLSVLLHLLLLHPAYALIPVTTALPGEPVTFTCFFPRFQESNARVKWYKQHVGDNLQLITTLMKPTLSPTFEQDFLPSRFKANYTVITSSLTILKITQEDEAMYHCGVTTWNSDQWSGTYLSVKGSTRTTTAYTVVQWPAATNPVRPGDAVTLQCSVHSASDLESCPGERSVHWFGVRSDQSLGNIIYTDKRVECDRKFTAPSPPARRCDYHFSKNISSSDEGTYFCAVAACGEIRFGNGTKLDIEVDTSSWFSDVRNTQNIITLLLCALLAISLIVIALLVCIIKRTTNEGGDLWIYSAAVFTVIKTDSSGKRGTKTMDREKIYAAVKILGLD